jgi:AraC-like DNA-binding protein
MPGRETSVSSQVKAELLLQFTRATKFDPFEKLCENLRMSPQVTRRRLSEEGSSFQKLKDNIRCDRACQLLKHSELSIDLIAGRIGFSEPAALNRAFKKWTGQTPAQYREQELDPQ